jgi:HK97 family phage portal protein
VLRFLFSSRRSLENPAMPLSYDAFTAGSAVDGTPVATEESAFGLITYYRGIALMSATSASLPLKIYRRGTRQRVDRWSVINEPNPAQTRFEFFETAYAHAIGWGNFFARKVKNQAGATMQLWPIHPSNVRCEVDPGFADDGKAFFVRDTKTKAERKLSSDDIFHVPGLSLDGMFGVSPVRLVRQSLSSALSAEEYVARFFSQGSMLRGVLSVDRELTADEAAQIKRAWRERVSGVENAHEIAVIDAKSSFLPVTIPPADAQLLESRAFSKQDICTLLGIPPHMLGLVEKSTSWGSGIEQQFIGWVTTNLRAWLTRFEQRCTKELVGPDEYAEYSLDGLLRGDSRTRSSVYALLIKSGVLSPNEARQLENLEPVDGLDYYLKPDIADVALDQTVQEQPDA